MVGSAMNEAAIKERPILFTGPMVQAILDGRKSQTRRVVKPQPDDRPGIDCTRLLFKRKDGSPLVDTAAEEAAFMCPYGLRGDRLWVRETFLIVGGEADHRIVYRASNDGPDEWVSPVWRPSIFMPRWASRITLEITGVRVERLQEITKADCLAEGIEYMPAAAAIMNTSVWTFDAAFRAGWNKINGKRAPWANNPWVWVVEFKTL